MKKRTIAAAGTSVALAAAGFAISTAGAASAHTQAPRAVTIAAKTTFSKTKLCMYPVSRPRISLGPQGQVVTKGSTAFFGGSAICNGHGVAGVTPKLHVNTVAGKAISGSCTASSVTGAYSCSALITAAATVHTKVPRAQSNFVSVKVK